MLIFCYFSFDFVLIYKILFKSVIVLFVVLKICCYEFNCFYCLFYQICFKISYMLIGFYRFYFNFKYVKDLMLISNLFRDCVLMLFVVWFSIGFVNLIYLCNLFQNIWLCFIRFKRFYIICIFMCVSFVIFFLFNFLLVFQYYLISIIFNIVIWISFILEITLLIF